MNGVRSTSRRRFLELGLGGFGALAMAACGGAAPTAAPPKPTEAPKPAAAAPTAAPAAAAPSPAATPPGALTKPADAAAKPAAEPTKPAAAPTAAPAATQPAAAQATAPAAAKPAGAAGAKGTLTVWNSLDGIPGVTDFQKAILADWSTKNGVELAYEAKSGAWRDQLLAAVQAGTPPDVTWTFDYQTQYWRGQNQAVDVTDVMAKLRTQEGGFFDYVEKTHAWQGKWWAFPWSINAWPMHVRQDLLDAKGLKWPTSWDEFRQTAKAVQKPPELYGFGYTVGKVDDTNNHLLAMLWTFGGQLQNEEGRLAVQANDKAWLETLKLTKALFEEDKVIPPGAVTWDNGGNNNGYQSGQLWATSNPTSIYTWLVQNNKPDLVKGTKFYPYPKGPAGEFGQVDVWGEVLFKASKSQDQAKGAYEYFLTPSNYRKYISDLQGRFLPVYKNLVEDQMWKANPLYEQYTTIAKNGRIMAHAASPTAPYGDITTTFVIGDMMQDLLVKKQSPEQALATFVTRAKAIYDKYPTL